MGGRRQGRAGVRGAVGAHEVTRERKWNLVRQPCPKGGPDHEPFPNGYIERADYAGSLMARWSSQSRCLHCRLFGRWSR